jgi:membrane associated rhomboid family serine protease
VGRDIVLILPIATNVHLRRFPLATCVLIATNCGIWLVLQVLPVGRSLLVLLALAPARPSVPAAVMSCFLHASFAHLATNMIYLWLFGGPVEDRIGRLRYVTFYLAIGTAALFAQVATMWLPGPADPLVVLLGSSGAVAGVLGLFVVRFPRATVSIAAPPFLFGRRAVPGVGRLNALAAIAGWILLEAAMGFLSLDTGHVSTAHWSHLTGWTLGACVGVLLRLPAEGHAERVMEQAREAERRGAIETALCFAREHASLRPADIGGWCVVARLARTVRRDREASEAYRTALGLAHRARATREFLLLYDECLTAETSFTRLPAIELTLGRRAAKDGRLVRAASLFAGVAALERGDETECAALEELADLHLRTSNDGERGCEALRRIVERFPQTRAARRAARRLKEIEPLREPEGVAIVRPARGRDVAAHPDGLFSAPAGGGPHRAEHTSEPRIDAPASAGDSMTPGAGGGAMSLGDGRGEGTAGD